MRHPRLKPDHADTWHHCYNRIVGDAGNYPFTDADKARFITILKRVAEFYTVRVVAYAIMGNHFHLILQAPVEKPTEAEAAARYKAFHNGQREIKPGTAICRQWTERLRDVSWLMRHYQHLCTNWYNRTSAAKRRGTLWSGRFKNTILEDGEALWNCWSYVEANPLRAGLVDDAADYRFTSYGEWAQGGRHPFAAALEGCLAPALPFQQEITTVKEAMALLETRFSDEFPPKAEPSGTENETVADEAIAACQRFTLTLKRRVRYWTDGLVIGTELFVRETMGRVRKPAAVARHRLDKAASDNDGKDNATICSWRRLNPSYN